VALQTWLNLARIAHGPLFHRVTKNGKQPGAHCLNDNHIMRLVKRTALATGVRGDLSEADGRRKFTGHSLHADLATSANADECAHAQLVGGANDGGVRRRIHIDRNRLNAALSAF
jgi:integrase